MENKELKKRIEHFKNDALPRMIQGDAYYRTKNIEINKRDKCFWSIAANRSMTDYTKANNKLASNFAKIITDQKVNYSINRKLTLEGIEHVDIKKFKKTLAKVGRNATNEIYGLVQFYISETELKYKILPSQQCILVHNEEDNEKLDSVIRYYKDNDVEYAEIIGTDYTEIYRLEDDKWVLIDVKPHVQRKTVSTGQELTSEELQFGVVPVAILYNNDIMQTDLEMYKSYVDAYDFANSDFFNNLEDFQEMYWILKGYDGQDPELFVEEFKRSRIVKVGEGGDANQVAQEVPYQARQTALDIAKKDIYRFSMAVDPEAIKGDTTNVTIAALFSNLDLKANQFEMQIENFIEQCIEIINVYAGLTNKAEITEYKLEFSRSIIMNKESTLKMLQELGMKISNKTLLANSPIVDDVEEEEKLIEEENKTAVNNLGGGMGFGDE